MRAIKRPKPRLARVVLGSVALTALTALLAPSAFATNQNTTLGDDSQGCSVTWNASAVLDTDLTNDDPNYPGLMVDLQGNPVDPSNGGYIEEVSPAIGGAGLFELNHFYVGDQSSGTRTQMWRIPFATDAAMSNVQITFRVPEQLAGVPVTFDAQSTNARMHLWGAPYSNYTWANRTTATDNGDGTWTITMPDLHRGEATVFQFNIPFASPLLDTDQFVASATLTADSAAGECGYDPSTLPQPTPTDGLNVCQVEYLGRTVWNTNDADITDRTKYFNGVASDAQGEVNADGWGMSPAPAAGDQVTMRLYGATKIALENLRYEVQIASGGTFVPNATLAVDTPASGALQSNGYTVAVSGATMAAAGDVAGTIAAMPVNSSLSTNVSVILDGDSPIVLLHRLVGTRPGCDPVQPDATVTTSEWVDGDQVCATNTVTQTRTITTVEFVFSTDTFTWVAGEPQTVVETQQRPMTEAEEADCTVDSTEPPSVGGEVTDAPSGSDIPSGDASAAPPTGPSVTPAVGGVLANTGATAALAPIALALALLGGAALALRRRRASQSD